MKSTWLAFVILFIVSLGVAVSGYVMMERRDPVGYAGELWLQEDSILDPNSIRLAWGVRAPIEKRPDGWIFQVRLRANGSVWLRSMWYETNQVFYEWHGSTLEHTITIDVDEKTSAMEWVWYLYNPSSTTVRLHTLHVTYSGVRQPLRSTGIVTVTIGVFILTVSVSKLVQHRVHARFR